MLTRSIACLFLVALAACSKDAKSLTDSGYASLGKGDSKGALSEFEAALPKIDATANADLYRRAAIGRCEALARIDPKRARTEFVALVKAQPGRIVEGDLTAIVHGMTRARTPEALKEAIELLDAAKTMYPDSPKLDDIAKVVVAEATRANDPVAIERLKSMGYVGGSK